ncbi:TetR/AcrR family transcriptional regulator [Blastococcus haudaquaticus]|nr:TetR/AcrR family transcriptional regulator [Blastococcus haudaquaticus]
MPRVAAPAVRTALVEAAAEMLAGRVAVTARSLADRAGTSTTAVYTHFGGMPGLWRAVRQEGFTRLAGRLAEVPRTDDAVHDLAALGAAYVAAAHASPFLYRAMFDAAADLEDPAAADASFSRLVEAAERARQAGRFSADADPAAVATRFWAAGHGLTMLVLTDVLPPEASLSHGPELAVAVCVAAGDDLARCRESVLRGWAPTLPGGPIGPPAQG